MSKSCWNWLVAAALVLGGVVTGCGTGMVKTVEAAENPNARLLQLASKSRAGSTSNGVFRSIGIVGQSFSIALQDQSSSSQYKWTVQSGSLPKGVSLSSNGVMSGTFAAAGTWNATIQVTDSSHNQSKQQQIAIDVLPAPLGIQTASFSAANANTPYSATLAISGGTPSYTWSISSGTLPAGLSLSSNGVISGTPTSTGTNTFALRVRDSGQPAQQQTKTFSMNVAPAALTVSTTGLNAGQVGVSYSAQLQASGGTSSSVWSIASGSLPTGLALNSAGVISGTPSATGSFSFSVAVSDATSSARSTSKTLSINVSAATLTITTGTLAAGQNTINYAAQLSVSGGTPGYTWTITSGSLPSGLSLQASTGAIVGTPSSTTNSAFTYKVTDNGNPQQTATATAAISISAAPTTLAGPGTAWFIRPDGGTRYSANSPKGQCDGKADTAYTGVGTNQHCAFNDVRWMWFNNTYGNYGWVMQGGDTLVIRGCSANGIQQNRDNPHCRLGGDKATGSDAEDVWCIGASSCVMPPPPSGTATQHTRILGGCAYDGNCNPVTGYPYTNNNLAQLFGGFNVATLVNMQGSKYVDLEGLELTTHNGQCARFGTTNALPRCNRIGTYPMSDQADQGIATDNYTSNILLRDIYIHGFSSSGMSGPIGGSFTLTRVIVAFNAFAGWNFDQKDGSGVSIPNAAGSSITQSYMTMFGNGCQEEYPITHTQFPAKGCWDSENGGFGDAWSAQDSIPMDSFTCDHCLVKYNTKDGAMGPHTLIRSLVLTNSTWEGNMGSAHKWGVPAGGTLTLQNTINVGNCTRMSELLPGAAQNFDRGTNLLGSGLSNYCRAGGAVFAISADAGTINFSNNTVVTYQPTIWQLSCTNAGCGTTFHFTDNLVLGYTSSRSGFQTLPAVYWIGDPSIRTVGDHNLEYGIRNGDGCGQNGNICTEPLLANEPAQGSVPPEAILDGFNFHPTLGSPAVSYGKAYTGAPATDFYGRTQTPVITVGAVAP